MNILLVSDFREGAGAEKAVLGLEAGLKERGHQVDFFFGSHEIKPPSLWSFFNPWAYMAMAKQLKRNHYDLIHVNKFNRLLSPSIFLAIRKYAPKAAVVAHIHDVHLLCPKWGVTGQGGECPDGEKDFSFHRTCMQDPHGAGLLRDLFKVLRLYFYRKTLRGRVDGWICSSRRLAEKMIPALQITADKMRYLANPIVLPEEKPSFDSCHFNRFIFVGRMAEEKGVYLILEALRQLSQKKACRGIELHLAGDGPDLEGWRQEVEEQGLSDRVVFLGRIQGEALKKEYREAAVLITPGLWYENNPFTALEAMGYGRPVLASGTGGYDMVEEGETGWFFRLGSAEELARAMEKVYNNKAEITRMGSAAHEKVQRDFDPEIYFKQLIDFYQSLIAEK